MTNQHVRIDQPSSLFKNYLGLTKPGIIFGNAITGIAGFALGSHQKSDWFIFFSMLLGLSLVIASACVCNNCLDRQIDKKMLRTRNRALVTGAISLKAASYFSIILGSLGLFILASYTSYLAAYSALTGFIGYVLFYGFSKYYSVHGTLIGSLAGACPPLVGYFAIHPEVDEKAFFLFLITALWQMPHFYAIAMYRLEDYREAGMPILPLSSGIEATKHQIFCYTLAFTAAIFSFGFMGFLSVFSFIISAFLSIIWLWIGSLGFRCENDNLWARKVFLFSLVVIMAFSLLLVIDAAIFL